MSVRRPFSAILVLLCVLACALTAGAAPAGAVTQFGSYGAGAGQFIEPWGVAVDQAADGDVYVADLKNSRVDVFETSGKFVMAWGWGVLSGAKELQTCTVSCERGISGEGSGQFGELLGIAVDNDPLSSSYGDVYVESGKGYVEKFDSSGKYLLTIGAATGNGHLSASRVVAVGPEGKVYAGDRARVQVYEPSGVWLESISLAGLSSNGSPEALAVDGSGDIFVKDFGVPSVRELEANGTEKATQFDAGSEKVLALAVDGSGDLFVGETSVLNSPGTYRVLEYSPVGEQIASFGNESSLGFREGIAFASVLGVGELYVTNITETTAYVSVEPTSVAGPPVIEPGSVSSTPGQRGKASVAATIDPEGSATSYRVEYIDEEGFQASGYAGASSTPEASLGPKFEEVPVTVQLSGLTPGATYHYRFVATSSAGSETGPDQTFTEVPPALIGGPWVASVTSTSATFATEVDPLGLSTEYSMEYGTSTAYGQSLSGNAGDGEGYMPVSFHRQNLTPGTVYHYRVVVHNEAGSFASADHVFTTQPAVGQVFSLPDGRAWELVSPPNKNGALIGPIVRSAEPDQAASDGGAVAYEVSEPIGEGAVGHSAAVEVLSTRGAGGWGSQDVSTRNALPPEGERPSQLAYGSGAWHVFSADLSVGLYEPGPGSAPAVQSPEASERTLYLRDSDGTFLPLETSADVSTGNSFGDPEMRFLAGTPDLSHVVFASSDALTPEAVEGVRKEGTNPPQNLYEWSREGGLQLVNVAPGTSELPEGATEPGAEIGSAVLYAQGMSARAISTDGRWIVWGKGELLGGQKPSPVSLYVRDMVGRKTFRLGGGYVRFETMSSDGSDVFFAETADGSGGDLYVFDTVTGTQTDITAQHGAGETAGVQDAVMGASEDGSYVYFVATGVLAAGAVKGADNIYVAHDTAGGWTTTFVAMLSGEDAKSWHGYGDFERPSVENNIPVKFGLVSSRVSPNGRYLVFMSERSLTGYDNLDAISGQPDEEVYLYDAVSNRLVCASCDPSGARPVGVYDNRLYKEPLLVDPNVAWSAVEGSGNHWLAGSVPGWENSFNGGVIAYQPRYLSDSGRVFFDSPDALVPQDTNGLEDVYEYEPAGVGSCVSASSTFSEGSNGCVGLISSGQSSSESSFVDASETGNDVFFDTTSKLTGLDVDTTYDIYDARVCEAGAPCPVEPVSPPSCASGDSCKAAPSPQPEIFGPAPSATFSGIGNVSEEAKPSVVKPKKKGKSKSKAGKHKQRPKKTKKARKARSNGKGR
jgi:hypothetical protein